MSTTASSEEVRSKWSFSRGTRERVVRDIQKDRQTGRDRQRQTDKNSQGEKDLYRGDSNF